MLRGIKVGLVATMAVAAMASPAGAQFGDATRPYQYVTGSFEAKKDAGISFLISNPATTNASVAIKLYTATTQVGSTFTVNVQARNTLTAILFPTSTGLHFAELNSSVPNISVQYRHVDAGSVTHFVDAGDVLRIDYTLPTAAAVSGVNTRVIALQSSTATAFGELGSLIDGLTPKVDALTPKVDALTPKVDAIGPKVDALGPKIDGLAQGSAQPASDPALAKHIATVETQVKTLRSELRSLRRLIVRRLPARRR